jgi:hypothetical protein
MSPNDLNPSTQTTGELVAKKSHRLGALMVSRCEMIFSLCLGDCNSLVKGYLPEKVECDFWKQLAQL